MIPSRIAASRTVRAIGPAVSWLCAIGMIPARLTKPRVGLIPTIPFADDGQTIDPSVSVPIASADRFAETAPADPELDPHALRSSTYGFFASPPRPLQPLVESDDLKFAHSLRFVLPCTIAPAALTFAAMNASCGAMEPASASDPAV